MNDTQMKYSHNHSSKYVSVMVPLNTGQSKQIMLKICDRTLCYYCQINACVNMPDGKRVCVGECADCALSNWFSNSYGYLIPPNICMDEFLKNESKYTLTPTTWLSAYLDNSLTMQILRKYHSHDPHKLSLVSWALTASDDMLPDSPRAIGNSPCLLWASACVLLPYHARLHLSHKSVSSIPPIPTSAV